MTEEKKSLVPPPPPRGPRRGLLVEVPKTVTTPDNLSTPNSGLQDMNFKVPPDFHRAFKTAAVMRGMNMKELLEASFQCWVETYGDDQLKAFLPMLKK
jgi:hypothetical protein